MYFKNKYENYPKKNKNIRNLHIYKLICYLIREI